MRVPPVVPEPHPEAAVYAINWLSATGSGIFLASILAGLTMGSSIGEMARVYWRTLKLVRLSLVTISAMMAVGFTTRYSGMDATLGLAFAQTGFLYPFFGTMLGWLGVALTGSDTSSNVLFGSLQKITAEQLSLSPVLMAAANSSGGVMGKMIDAQSIVVASTATRWYGHEGDILRYVFFHSLVLACLVGLLVMLQAYVRRSLPASFTETGYDPAGSGLGRVAAELGRVAPRSMLTIELVKTGPCESPSITVRLPRSSEASRSSTVRLQGSPLGAPSGLTNSSRRSRFGTKGRFVVVPARRTGLSTNVHARVPMRREFSKISLVPVKALDQRRARAGSLRAVNLEQGSPKPRSSSSAYRADSPRRDNVSRLIESEADSSVQSRRLEDDELELRRTDQRFLVSFW